MQRALAEAQAEKQAVMQAGEVLLAELEQLHEARDDAQRKLTGQLPIHLLRAVQSVPRTAGRCLLSASHLLALLMRLCVGPTEEVKARVSCRTR